MRYYWQTTGINGINNEHNENDHSKDSSNDHEQLLNSTRNEFV